MRIQFNWLSKARVFKAIIYIESEVRSSEFIAKQNCFLHTQTLQNQCTPKWLGIITLNYIIRKSFAIIIFSNSIHVKTKLRFSAEMWKYPLWKFVRRWTQKDCFRFFLPEISAWSYIHIAMDFHSNTTHWPDDFFPEHCLARKLVARKSTQIKCENKHRKRLVRITFDKLFPLRLNARNLSSQLSVSSVSIVEIWL